MSRSEDPIAKWRKDHAAIEAERDAVRRLDDQAPTERRLDAVEQQVNDLRSELYAQLEVQRQLVLEVVAQGFGEALLEQRQDTSSELRDAVRELRGELCQAQTTIAELRVAVAEVRVERARSTVVDMPLSRSVN
jgi:hypothetical protein